MLIGLAGGLLALICGWLASVDKRLAESTLFKWLIACGIVIYCSSLLSLLARNIIAP